MELHARSGCFHIFETRIWNESMWREAYFSLRLLFHFGRLLISFKYFRRFFFQTKNLSTIPNCCPAKMKWRAERNKNILLMIKAKLRTFSFYLRYKSHIFAILIRCYTLHCFSRSTRGVSRARALIYIYVCGLWFIVTAFTLCTSHFASLRFISCLPSYFIFRN